MRRDERIVRCMGTVELRAGVDILTGSGMPHKGPRSPRRFSVRSGAVIDIPVGGMAERGFWNV